MRLSAVASIVMHLHSLSVGDYEMQTDSNKLNSRLVKHLIIEMETAKLNGLIRLGWALLRNTLND